MRNPRIWQPLKVNNESSFNPTCLHYSTSSDLEKKAKNAGEMAAWNHKKYRRNHNDEYIRQKIRSVTNEIFYVNDKENDAMSFYKNIPCATNAQ